MKSLFRQDINNKLFISIGYLELIDSEELSEKDEEHLRRAIESNIKVLDLIELEKEAKRAKEKRFPCKKELEDIFKDALETCRPFTEKREIKITSDIKDKIGNVLGGRSLEKIIVSLVKTTIRRRKCRKIRLIGKIEGDKVLVSIEDDGEPLSGELKEKILKGEYTGRVQAWVVRFTS